MLYKGDIGLYLSGSPVSIPSCALYITQPNIKQIIQLGETEFLMASQMFGRIDSFTSDIKKDNSQLENLTDFEILLLMISQQLSIKQYFNVFFELTCPEYIVQYKNHSIEFYIEEENKKVLKGQITPFNFEDFQTVVRELFVANNDSEPEYNLANDKAREIYEKIKRGRERVQAQQGGKGSSNNSLYGTYASILAIGLQMDINIFFNYTPFQITDAFNRYWLKVNSDFYRKVASTPLMDVSKMEEPDEWTRNLYTVDNN